MSLLAMGSRIGELSTGLPRYWSMSEQSRGGVLILSGPFGEPPWYARWHWSSICDDARGLKGKSIPGAGDEKVLGAGPCHNHGGAGRRTCFGGESKPAGSIDGRVDSLSAQAKIPLL